MHVARLRGHDHRAWRALTNLNGRVAAIAVTAQGDGCWLVDRDGGPVGGGLLWLDSRAASIAAAHAKSAVYPRHYELTGSGVNACMASSQMAWMKLHQPERLLRSATLFHCKDWLFYRLTGERVTDPSEAVFTFGDFRTRTYKGEILDGMGIADCLRLLPPIFDGSKDSRPLSAAGAAATGLVQGVPVVLGYVDVACTALGGGLYDRSGEVGFSVFGSTGVHMRYAPTAPDVRLNEARSGYTMCFPVERSCASMQSNMAATINIDWALDLICEAAALAGGETSRKTLLNGLDAKILEAAPGQAVFHPYILEAGERGPFLDANARAQFSGLSTETSLVRLVRSIYEGLAFAAIDCYATEGEIPKEVRLGGGAARSKALRSIVASALGSPVRVLSREELGAAGAAMMAAACIGAYQSVAACAGRWVTPLLGPSTPPDPALAETYRRLFPIYRLIRTTMPSAWSALSQARQRGAQ